MQSRWQDEARKLRFGESRKVVCCGNSPSAYMSNSERGLSFYCFRAGCDQQLFEKHEGISAADFVKWREKDTEVKKQWSPDVVPLSAGPREALLWVLKAGFTPEEMWERYGVGWNEFSQRVIIPMDYIPHLHSVGPAFIGRAVMPGHSPKYISSKGAKGRTYAMGSGYTVVVVEDVLSCMKVAQAGLASVALMGTSVAFPVACALSKYRTIIGWLDGDKAGDAAYAKLRRAMRTWDKKVHRIRTDDDPKLHSTDDIRLLVEDAWQST